LSDLSPQIRRELFGWHSDRLGLDMPIVRYGHWGPALLIFPTAGADFLEYERFGLIKAIEHHLTAGRLTIYSIDSINRHAWMNPEVPASERIRRQALYEGYVEDEVVPHIRRCLQNPGARIGSAGASFGAFHAANAFFRRPDLFDTLVAMSGFYDLAGFLGGHTDGAYFHNPAWYVSHLNDGRMFDLLRHSRIHLMTGQGAWEKPELTRRFSQQLWDKGIWHNVELWGRDVNHDWPWWMRMMNVLIERRFGW